MSSFPQTLGVQNQKQAQALIKALGESGVHLRWRVISGKTPPEINNVLSSFSYSVAGQCYNETQIQRYVQLVGKMGFEKTKLAAETPIGSVYCMPIDAVAYRRRNPTSTEHLTVFVSEGIMPDGKFLVNTITHNPRQSKNCLIVKPVDYVCVNSISYIPCDRSYQYFLSIDELYGRMNRQGKYASLPIKEQAIKVEPFRQVILNQLLRKLNISGATYVPVCVMDGGVSYGIKREVATSTLLPETLKYQGLLGLRYNFMSIKERNQAREALEVLYRRSGTPANFIEAYKHYADLPLSYARYNLGIDKSPENYSRCIDELCISFNVDKKLKPLLKEQILPALPQNVDLRYVAEYAGSNIPSALNFYTLQIQHNGVLPNLQDPSEREKLRYLLESCPKDIDSALYLKQFAGRDVLTEYQHTKPITDPKLLELYEQFPVKEMSQIPLQNVNDFLIYLKDNELSAQDFGQITAEMVKNLTTPGTICKERGIAEYLKLNTVTDTNSLEHIDEISHHIGKTIDNGLDCVMHKGDTLASLIPPLNPINVLGNFIDL